MKNSRILIVTSMLFCLLPATVLAFGGMGSGGATSGSAAADALQETQDLDLAIWDPALKQEKRIPIFSTADNQTPLAVVNEDPITLKEFRQELINMHAGMKEGDAPVAQNFKFLLDRLVAVRLIEQESRNIGFHETAAFQSQVDSFAEKTLINELLQHRLKDIEPDGAKVEKRYREISLEARMDVLKFVEQAAAEQFLAEVKAGGDFEQLALKAVARGAAENTSGDEEKYLKFKELLPQVAQGAFAMQIGEVSQIFQVKDGYLLFKLHDRRFFEDPAARNEAQKIEYSLLRAQTITDVMHELTEKYAVFNDKTRDALDFEKLKGDQSGWQAADAFAKLEADNRILVTIKGKEPLNITVAEAAKEVKTTLFHGVDREMDAAELNQRGETVIGDKLFKIAAGLEARRLGIDKSEEYLRKIESFSRSLLFNIFVDKVVVPDVSLAEDEVYSYYSLHKDDYSSPAMVQLRSLVFHREQDARKAQERLLRGSDVRWVSANTEGLVGADAPGMLTFDGNILSATALPESLQAAAKTARKGNVFLYSDPGNLHYVLYVEAAYPPAAKPFEEVREDIARKIYNEKLKAVIDRWVGDLKKAYEVEIFVREG